ncbi:hypothetical protein TorRG33x02_102340 [Trema orientale]|uniref:Uncharacterized protein n=1 Tax=Trema orientale TaxID=63057 RepID=A0A2P5F7S1_TREOI|nr:hypothetical protein TorRG33x02_102340 [Trema orientale]
MAVVYGVRGDLNLQARDKLWLPWLLHLAGRREQEGGRRHIIISRWQRLLGSASVSWVCGVLAFLGSREARPP